MKRLVVAFTCLCFLSLSVLAQSGKTTRPRIVVTPTPEAVSPTQPTTTRPPVLKGDTSVRTQTETTTEDAPEADDEIIRIETN
ncbi:MAG TPA: hypothetical protein VK308_08870, partial [Pyrinomonadaceae bacterium]|nr:hypothetical protein [Pyrinomonadaceae bacterium]